MGIYSIKPMFQKSLSPLTRLFVKNKIHPTVINVLGFVSSIFAAFFIYYSSEKNWLLLLVPVAAFVRTAFNALDGLVARALKVKNQNFGEVMNEFIDRVSDVIIFGAFMFTDFVEVKLAAISVFLVLLVSYLGIVGKAAGGSRQYVGMMGKADRMFYLSAACLIAFFFAYEMIFVYLFYFMIVLSILTIVQRFSAIKKELYNARS